MSIRRVEYVGFRRNVENVLTLVCRRLLLTVCCACSVRPCSYKYKFTGRPYVVILRFLTK